MFLDYQSLTVSNPRQHIWTFASGRGERFDDVNNCPCKITVLVLVLLHLILLHMLAIIIIVNQLLGMKVIMTHIISMTHYGTEKDV